MGNKTPKYKLIDLFCGCGGMSLGFKWDFLFNKPPINHICKSNGKTPETKIEIVWANDNNRDAIDTYMANFDKSKDHTKFGNIEEIIRNGEKFPKADIVIGGPPCQGRVSPKRHPMRRGSCYLCRGSRRV